MNVLGRIFLNSRKDRRSFFVRSRRTYVLKNIYAREINFSAKKFHLFYLLYRNELNTLLLYDSCRESNQMRKQLYSIGKVYIRQ